MFAILSQKTFGPFSRYCLKTCRDRFGDTVYLVADANQTDEVTGRPAVIRIERTIEAAVANLDVRDDYDD